MSQTLCKYMLNTLKFENFINSLICEVIFSIFILFQQIIKFAR